MAPAPQVLAEHCGVRAQPLPLGVFLAPPCLLPLAGLIVRTTSAAENREEITAFLLARQPLWRDQRAADVPGQRGSRNEHPVLVDRPPAGGEERARPLLAGGDEQERRAVLVALPPAFELRVFAVALGLRLELAGRHRPEVQLDQAEQEAPVRLRDLDAGVRRHRVLLAVIASERLSRFCLPFEAGEPQAVRQLGLQRHVQLADRGGVGEEEGIRLAPLAPARRRSSFGDRLALPRRPKMMRRRSAFPVGPSSPDEAMLGEAGGSIAKRSWLDLGRHQTGELRLGQDPEEGEEIEDATVEVGERGGLSRGASTGGATAAG